MLAMPKYTPSCRSTKRPGDHRLSWTASNVPKRVAENSTTSQKVWHNIWTCPLCQTCLSDYVTIVMCTCSSSSIINYFVYTKTQLPAPKFWNIAHFDFGFGKINGLPVCPTPSRKVKLGCYLIWPLLKDSCKKMGSGPHKIYSLTLHAEFIHLLRDNWMKYLVILKYVGKMINYLFLFWSEKTFRKLVECWKRLEKADPSSFLTKYYK